jgi:3-oxoacyl-[acyl-carrier-protein] synthase II
VPTLGSLADRLAQGLAPRWVVSTACTSGLVALVDAACAMLDGEAQEMVVCGIDAASEFVRQGFGALKAISPAGVCRPFDRERDGLMLGTWAAACRLARGGRGRVTLRGWSLAGDATHMTAPDREGRGLVRAMEGALAHAGLGAGEIDVVVAHGTGTRYNDAMEAVAFGQVFGGLKQKPAITAVKGVIRHTLGASGLIEAILAARIIEAQTVPAIVGLREAEQDGLDFVTRTRAMRVRHVMKVASGFGGLNAAVILSGVE